jgi:phosphoserine phosphatase
VHLQDADEVWARIEDLRRRDGGAGVVASDGDGTLWSGDVGEDLFHAFTDHGEVTEAAFEAMRREACAFDLSDAGTGGDVARRIYAAYVEGRFPEERMCELMVWCFAGWTRERVQAFAREVIDRGNLGARLHGEVLRVIERVRGAGIPVLVVSASPVAVVVEAASRVGFREDEVVAARPRYDGDLLAAAVERPIPYGEGKVTRLRERIGEARPLYAAFGDNVFDVALLSSARVGVAVRPKPRLRQRAHEVPDVVELAPEPSPPGSSRGSAPRR